VNTREGKPNESQPVSTLFSCGHRKLFIVLPHLLEKHWCQDCDMPRIVVVVEEYQVRCTVCRYGRFCGANLDAVFILASRHFAERGHICKYRQGRKKWRTVSDETVTQSELEI
jgi:hypothetical protein